MKHIEEEESGSLTNTDIMNRYHETTSMAHLPRWALGRMIKRLFPKTRHSSKRSLDTNHTIYRGIRWNVDGSENVPQIQLTDISAHIPRNVPAAVVCETEESVVLAITTNIVCNGSFLMKEVEIKDNVWSLKIRGADVDLNKIGIDDSYDGTSSSLKQLLHQVNKIKVCQGTKEKTTIQELVCTPGDKVKTEERSRCKKCFQCIPWLAVSDACHNCLVSTNKKQMYKRRIKSRIVSKSPQSVTPLITDEAPTPVSSTKTNEPDNKVHLTESDNKDLSEILETIFPGASKEMKVLLQAQNDALKAKDPHLRRWDNSVITMCLNMWLRSPQSYQDLKNSNMLILPSGRMLQRYKNKIPQVAGINDAMFEWMYEAAKDGKLAPEAYSGGLLHDEMKIQEELVFQNRDDHPRLIGFIEAGDEARDVRILQDGKIQRKLASQVWQVTFVSYSGFRFPICHFPVDFIKVSDMTIHLWKIIGKLSDYGFQVDYILQDGGEENRQFIKSQFVSDPLEAKYESPNLIDLTKTIVHCQDYSHIMKKIRNSVLHSGNKKGVHTRLIKKNGNEIAWEQWEEAVKWDRSVNSRPIHYKITDEHINPDGPQKMRNQLAEEMLDNQMLFLMKSYQQSIHNGHVLDDTIDFLTQTSCLISIFRSSVPITSKQDDIFTQLSSVFKWFFEWRQMTLNDCTVPKTKRGAMLPTRECLDDLLCLLAAFPRICEIHLERYPSSQIIPAQFNNDLAENVFCQIRGLYNGNTTHPNYASYCATVNSIILGQSMISRGRKGNAKIAPVKPFNFYLKKRLNKK